MRDLLDIWNPFLQLSRECRGSSVPQIDAGRHMQFRTACNLGEPEI